MKKVIIIALAVLVMFGMCSCQPAMPEPEPEPKEIKTPKEFEEALKLFEGKMIYQVYFEEGKIQVSGMEYAQSEFGENFLEEVSESWPYMSVVQLKPGFIKMSIYIFGATHCLMCTEEYLEEAKELIKEYPCVTVDISSLLN